MADNLIKTPQLITTQLCERFKAEIEAGKYAHNQPLPAFGVLAKTYNISKSTVHEAFKILAREGYLFIKHGKGAFANQSKILRKDNRKLTDVAIIAFNIFSPNDNYLIPFLEAVNGLAMRRKIRLDFNFIRGMSLLSPDNRIVSEAIADGRYDGIIIASPLDIRDLKWLKSLKVPFVAATSRYDVNVPQVLLDNTLAAKLAADIFVRRGAKKLAVFTGPLSFGRKGIVPYSREISDVFNALKKEQGLDICLVSCDYNYADAWQKALELFTRSGPFDGLFFQSDIIAKGVIAALKNKDIDTTGMTIINYCELEDYLAPINILKPLKDMGREAFTLLERLLLGKEIKSPILLKPEYISKEKKDG